MNKTILMGRATKDSEVRYTQGNEPMAIARFTLAVDRRGKKNDGEQTADFVNIVAFGKQAEFCEKYVKKGTKILLTGRIQTGSYTDRDGKKVYTTEVVAEELEFAESKKAETQAEEPKADNEGFFNVPEDGDIPFGQFR